MKFVILSDAHLFPILRAKVPQMRGDSFEAAREVIETANSIGAPLLIPGDIFDFGERGGIADCMRFLADTVKTPAYYIVGNHDASGRTGLRENENWLQSVPGFTSVHNCFTTLEGDITLGGLDYQRGRETWLEAVKSYTDKPDIFLCHQPFQEMLKFEGAWSAKGDDLADKARLVICGDVHTTAEWKVGNTVFLSPGSPVRTSIDDTEDKTFPIVTFEGDNIEIEHVEINNRRDFFRRTVVTDKDRQEFLGWLREYECQRTVPDCLKQCFVQLKYVPEGSFWADVKEAAEGRAYVEATPMRLHTAVAVGVEEEAGEGESEEETIARITRRYADPDTQKDLYELLVQIQLNARTNQDAVNFINDAVDRILDGNLPEPVMQPAEAASD